MSTRKQVYRAIDTERLLQELMIEASTGTRVEQKPVESFGLYIQDYATQLQTQLSRIWGPESKTRALDTIRKIAALCVAAMEQHGAQDRKFPVLAKINGQMHSIEKRGAICLEFGAAPVKAEGEKVAFDPVGKAIKRIRKSAKKALKKARKHK